MSRQDYLKLAAAGLKMPIGADLVLRERPDAEAVLLDGPALGEVVATAARRYHTPLAFPVMDLAVEKSAMLSAFDVPPHLADAYHFDSDAPADAPARIDRLDLLRHPRMRANAGAIATVANQRDLISTGMVIGPFSLMTKLLADPITPTFIAGSGVSADEDDEVRRLENVLELATATVLRSVAAQLAAGAKAIVVCEPAANKVYFSPNQLAAGSDIFQRYAMGPNRRLAAAISAGGADLIFHCCGELIDSMVRDFASLRPVILSLGSSRRLWEDARLIASDIVLFGNLPSKRFISDGLSFDDVRELSRDLCARMRETAHPFILGTECDVLSVPGFEHVINSKITAMLEACDQPHAAAAAS